MYNRFNLNNEEFYFMLNLTTPSNVNCAKNNAPTILIIEDSAADRILITKQLMREWPSATILYAEYLADAYMICRENQIDFFLLDLHLPDAFGAATVETLRQFDRNSAVIAITSTEEATVLDNALKNGATEVIHKSKLMSDQFIHALRHHHKQTQRISA